MADIRYRCSSQKNKAEECKSLQTTSLCYSIAKSTPQVLLTFIKFQKTKHEYFNTVNFLSFFLLLSSYSATHNFKTIRHMWLIYISNDRIIYISNDCSAAGYLPFLVWGSVRATTSDYGHETVSPVCKTFSFSNSVASVYVFQVPYFLKFSRELYFHLFSWLV